MPLNKDPNHVHKLKRFRYKTGGAIYFCVSDCSFRVGVELSLGRKSECWRCGKPFSMNKYSTNLDKPHCEECHTHKADKRLGKKARKVESPLTAVADSVGVNLVTDLKSKIAVLLDAPSEDSKTIKVIEFELENEEDDYL